MSLPLAPQLPASAHTVVGAVPERCPALPWRLAVSSGVGWRPEPGSFLPYPREWCVLICAQVCALASAAFL